MTLVHSRAALDELEARCPESVIRAVRMGIELPEVVSRDEARLQLGLGKQIVMASFGLVSPEKRISIALRCLKRMLDEDVDVRYLLVGGTVAHYNARREAEQLGVAERILLTERVSESDFRLYASAADICLNLRYPSAGGTSATLLRLLAAGRAVMVTDQMRELDYPRHRRRPNEPRRRRGRSLL